MEVKYGHQRSESTADHDCSVAMSIVHNLSFTTDAQFLGRLSLNDLQGLMDCIRLTHRPYIGAALSGEVREVHRVT
nr:MAG TPA: hypothetical protein [Caudoviricetes sp.]